MRFLIRTALLLLLLCALFYVTTGSPLPLVRIDQLKSPLSVSSFKKNQIVLTDGRTLPFADAGVFLSAPPIARDITGRGIEISPNGHVYGLFFIRHRDRGDLVRYHLARLDLQSVANLLAADPQPRMFKEGLSASDLPDLRLERFVLEKRRADRTRQPDPSSVVSLMGGSQAVGSITVRPAANYPATVSVNSPQRARQMTSLNNPSSYTTSMGCYTPTAVAATSAASASSRPLPSVGVPIPTSMPASQPQPVPVRATLSTVQPVPVDLTKGQSYQ